MKQRERRQQQFLKKARKLLKPTEVTLDRSPLWFTQGVRKALASLKIRHSEICAKEGWSLLIDCLNADPWIDHAGTTVYYERECAVSEPYTISAMAVEAIDRLCCAAGFHWTLCSNSWHFPGRTLRILIFPDKIGTAPRLGFTVAQRQAMLNGTEIG